MMFTRCTTMLLGGLLVCAALAKAQSDVKSSIEIPLDDFPAMVEGYRVQLGAFASEAAAVEFQHRLEAGCSKKTHLNYSDGFWRVRVGDFRDSTEALRFLTQEMNDDWGVNGLVVRDKIPLAEGELERPARLEGYRIQVNAFSTRESALEFAVNLTLLLPDLRVYVVQEDPYYKIRLGDFRSQSEAAEKMKMLDSIPDLAPILVKTLINDLPPLEPGGYKPVDVFEYDD
jgi:cell division septation protein DedD